MELEGVIRGGFKYMKKLVNECVLNLNMDSIIFYVSVTLSSLE